MPAVSAKQLYQDLKITISSLAAPTQSKFDVAKYLGSSREYLNISTPKLRQAIKQWRNHHLDISFSQLKTLLSQLNEGKSFQELAAVGYLLEYFPEHRRQLDPNEFIGWLKNRGGWGEIDTLCQSTFTAEDLLSQWHKWQLTLDHLRNSNNINLRRASLVLLVKPLSQSNNNRFAAQALVTLQQLQTEREILITKAVSWALRAMIKHHPAIVKSYLENNQAYLPPIAYREALRKLTTGRKN